MSQINVNNVLPQSGNIVKVNGTSIRSTLNTVQLNTYPLDIPSTNSVVIGAFAGDALSAGSEGNSIIGTFAGGSITTGSSNVCIGKSSGGHITTGAGNVYIGNGTGSNVNPIGGNTANRIKSQCFLINSHNCPTASFILSQCLINK